MIDAALEVPTRHVATLRSNMVGRRANGSREHRFGGTWTNSKLKILGGYLAAYTQALKNQPFKTAYILIEKNRKRAVALQRLKDDFPDLAQAIDVRHQEANQSIRDLCRKDWRAHRAVLFLDPYGMQVEWATIEAIGRTKAIDLWILFPLGIAVDRLLTRSGTIPRAWRRRLDLLLGPGWYEAFYRVERAPSLFDDEATRVVKATTATIGKYFNDRLTSVFARVAEEPRVLVNSAGCPLYLLCFATGNAKGAPIALKIAGHLLKAGE